jgi:hypothetical protein
MTDELKPCCDDLKAAMCSGTDNEAYGRLISYWQGRWHTGCRLKPMNFCPWCGKSLGDENKRAEVAVPDDDVTHIFDAMDKAKAERDALKAENERLRRALEEIAKWYGPETPAHQTAKAALDKEQGE